MGIKITQNNSDFASLRALAESCLENYILPQEKIASRASKGDFTILFAQQGKGKKVGFIAGYSENNAMHIWLFGVRKGFRGKGIGALLLKKFHSLASKNGYNTVNTITFNKYKNKLVLSIKSGYKITAVKFIEEKNDSAIFLEKGL